MLTQTIAATDPLSKKKKRKTGDGQVSGHVTRQPACPAVPLLSAVPLGTTPFTQPLGDSHLALVVAPTAFLGPASQWRRRAHRSSSRSRSRPRAERLLMRRDGQGSWVGVRSVGPTFDCHNHRTRPASGRVTAWASPLVFGPHPCISTGLHSPEIPGTLEAAAQPITWM
jgi:hypothetical protein